MRPHPDGPATGVPHPYSGPSAYAHAQPLTTPEPMTEQEVKVLRLVAQGAEQVNREPGWGDFSL